MIKIKSATQIEQMKKAGALSKMALRHVGAMVRPGVSTFELDQLAEQIIRMHGGTPAFKGYGGVPGNHLRIDQRCRGSRYSQPRHDPARWRYHLH